MRRKILILGLLISFLSVSSMVFAEDVIVTARGNKYHKSECRKITNKKNTTTLSKEEAVELKYKPCGRCYKEDKIEENDE